MTEYRGILLLRARISSRSTWCSVPQDLFILAVFNMARSRGRMHYPKSRKNYRRRNGSAVFLPTNFSEEPNLLTSMSLQILL